MSQENVVKATTKIWYECGACQTKMDTMQMGKADDFSNMFGLAKTALSVSFYCPNKKCKKFGYLTVVGIKKEE